MALYRYTMASYVFSIYHSYSFLPPAGPHTPPNSLPSCLCVILSHRGYFCTPIVISDPTCILTHVNKLHTYTRVQLDTVWFIGLISCFFLFLTFWDCFFEFCWKHSQIKQLTFPQNQKWEARGIVPPLLLVFLSSFLYCLTLKYGNHQCINQFCINSHHYHHHFWF